MPRPNQRLQRRRFSRRQPRRPRRSYNFQHLVFPFCVNIVESGSQGITAGSLGIPNNRPARVAWLRVSFALKENATATTFPIFSAAIRDGNGETDARSRVVIVGPTVQSASVRAAPGVDFDHFDSSDTVVYFDVANFTNTNIITLVGTVGIQFYNQNNPTPIHIRTLDNILGPQALITPFDVINTVASQREACPQPSVEPSDSDFTMI